MERIVVQYLCGPALEPLQMGLTVTEDGQLAYLATWEAGPFDSVVELWKQAFERYWARPGQLTLFDGRQFMTDLRSTEPLGWWVPVRPSGSVDGTLAPPQQPHLPFH